MDAKSPEFETTKAAFIAIALGLVVGIVTYFIYKWVEKNKSPWPTTITAGVVVGLLTFLILYLKHMAMYSKTRKAIWKATSSQKEGL